MAGLRPDRRHVARRRRLPGPKTTSWIPAVPIPVPRQVRAELVLTPARRREVRRLGVQGVRRSARRRHLGGERAVEPALPRHRPRRRAPPYEVRRRRFTHGELEVTRSSPRGRTGTTVAFWPDPTIFDEVEFRAQTSPSDCRSCLPEQGLEIRFVDERAGRDRAPQTFLYNNGIVDYVRHLTRRRKRCFAKSLLREDRGDHGGRDRPPVEYWVLRSIHSFANGSPPSGRMHEEGFKKALTTW